MELKWLEDFISLTKTRNFSRSAVERNVTQSAFSRRIRSLEAWLGVALVDRSTFPTALTTEGRQFHETAEEVVRMLQASRAELQLQARPSQQGIAVAALHSLSLFFFPRWFRQVKDRTGPLDSRLLADDFHSCLLAITEGNYDFLLTFHHPDVPILLDPELFPYVLVGHDSLVPVVSPKLAEAARCGAASVLHYAPASFLGRITTLAQGSAERGTRDGTHMNENAMAEALKSMVLEEHGMAWLPRSSVEEELSSGRLAAIAGGIPLEIRLYRNARRLRPAVEAVWAAAGALAASRSPAGADRLRHA